MNLVRLTCHVLPLSILRSAPFALNTAIFSRFVHQNPAGWLKDVTRKPINHHIPREVVQVVNSDGKLETPEPLVDVLARIDLNKFFVELVASDKSVVKVYSKKEEKAKAKARAKAQKASMRSNDQKEIQMTWGVAPGDLAHKLEKARTELEKGNRVDLIFAAKSKQPVPPPRERDERVAEVLDTLKGVGKECESRTFKRGSTTIHLRGID